MNPQVIQNLSWWQVGVGVLSIPVTLLGLVYTWVLIRKTNLEARKIRLEIAEKEATALSAATSRLLEHGEVPVLSRFYKSILAVFVVFSVYILFSNGLKMRPLYGFEVLEMVLAAVSCILILAMLIMLQLLRQARHSFDSDMKLARAITETLQVSKGARRGSDER